MVRFYVYVVWSSVLSLNDLKVLKIHKIKAIHENINVYKKNLYFG